MSGVLIRSMFGLGDNVYARAFVRHYPGAHIITPWPEVFEGLGVKCCRAETRLRTQNRHIRRTDYPWSPLPPVVNRIIRLGYSRPQMARGSIVDAMAQHFDGHSPVFDLPATGPAPWSTGKPVAIVRPATLRREWMNSARNPDPEYLAQAADILHKRGYHVITVADVAPTQEWIIGPVIRADERYHDGQWTVRDLMAAMKHAAVVVGGVGWVVPMRISAGGPLFVVLGGNGGNNAPGKITSPEMDVSQVGWASPDPLCGCFENAHNCKKEIHGFADQFEHWLDARGL